jgi:hypothetical protein
MSVATAALGSRTRKAREQLRLRGARGRPGQDPRSWIVRRGLRASTKSVVRELPRGATEPPVT